MTTNPLATTTRPRGYASWSPALQQAFDLPPETIHFRHLRHPITAFPVPFRNPDGLSRKRGDSPREVADKKEALRQWYQEKLFLVHDNGSSAAWSVGRMDEGMISVECRKNLRRLLVVFW